jgi:hypothetical protein
MCSRWQQGRRGGAWLPARSRRRHRCSHHRSSRRSPSGLSVNAACNTGSAPPVCSPAPRNGNADTASEAGRRVLRIPFDREHSRGEPEAPLRNHSLHMLLSPSVDERWHGWRTLNLCFPETPLRSPRLPRLVLAQRMRRTPPYSLRKSQGASRRRLTRSVAMPE